MRYLRLLRYLVLGLMLPAALYLATQYQNFLEQTARVLSLQLSAWLGEEVRIEHLEVDLWQLSVHARNIRVTSLRRTEAPCVAHIPSMTVRLAAIPERGRLHIRAIELEEPVVDLRFLEGVLQDFPGMMSSAGTEEAPSGGGTRIDVDRVVLRAASIHAADEAAGWEVHAPRVDLEMSLVDGRPGRVVLVCGPARGSVGEVEEAVDSLAARLVFSSTGVLVKELRLELPGTVLEGEGEGAWRGGVDDGPRLSLNVTVRADLAFLERLVPDVPDMAGNLSFSGVLDYSGEVRVAGEADFDAVRIGPYQVGDGVATLEADSGRIEVLEGRLDRPGGHLSFTGILKLEEQWPLHLEVGFHQVQLADLFEAVSITGPWVDMRLSAHGTLEGSLEPVDLHGRVTLSGRTFRVWDESYRSAGPDSLVLGLEQVAFETGFEVDGHEVRVIRGRLETPGSTLFLDGAIRFDESMDLAFDAARLDLSEICPLAGYAIAGKGWGRGRVHGPFSALVGSADLRLFGARFDTYYLGEFTGRFLAPLASGRYFRDLAEAGEEVRSAGGTDGETGGEAGFDGLETALLGLSDTYYGGEMFAQDPPLLMVSGGTVAVGETRADGALIVVFGHPMTIYGTATIANEGLEGRPAGRLADLLTIAGADLPDRPLDGLVYGHATVHGDPLALNGSGRLVLARGQAYGQVVDHAEVRFRLDSGALLVDDLTATLGGGHLFAAGELGAEGSLDASLLVQSLPLEALDALSTLPVQGRLDASVVLGGSWEAPQLTGSLTATEVAYAGTPVGETVLTFGMEENVLILQGLVLGQFGRLKAAVTMAPSIPYSVTLELDDLPLRAFLEAGAPAGQGARSRMSGVFWASGDLLGDTSTHVIAQLDAFTLDHGGLSLTVDEPATLELYQGQWNLSPAHIVGDGTDLVVQGTVSADETVSMDVSGYFNLFFLDALLPGLFQRIDGRVTFVDPDTENSPAEFHVGGTLDALQFQGAARISDAALSTEYFPPIIDQLSARVVVGDGNVVEIQDVAGHVGGGRLTGRGRLILGEHYYPRFYDLELKAEDAFVQYLTDLPPGLMDAEIGFHGPVGNLLMSGDVYLKRMVYRERYNWEKYLTDFRTHRLEDIEIVDDEPPYFAIDIRIHAPGTFFIRNNLGQMQFKGELQVVGDTNVTQLLGEIESVRGTVTILDNTFELTQAKIEFTGDYWNPSLDIRMQTQIQSYTIYYMVTGTLEDWQLIPDSDSGLSERDINSLIAFGTLADNITEGNEARAVAAPALEFLIGRLGVLEQLQAFTRLDRFTIIPASDEAGNVGARVYGEKELIEQKLFFSGYYDYAVNGTQTYLMDLEWRTFDCCSLIFRLDGSDTVGAGSVRPGLRLKLKLEFE